jgi:nicotinamidase-related amidase
MPNVQVEPYEFEFSPRTTALLIIDMQRDFVDPGGFGSALGNDACPVDCWR